MNSSSLWGCDILHLINLIVNPNSTEGFEAYYVGIQ